MNIRLQAQALSSLLWLLAGSAAASELATWLTHGSDRWVPAALHGTPLPKADFVVAADGSGTHTTLQAAFDALPARGSTTARSTLHIRPGSYRERPCLRDKAPVLIAGDPADAAAVRIVAAVSNTTPKAPEADAHRCHAHHGHATHGTSGSATMVIASGDVQLRHLTVENEARDAQAVALTLRGDRVQLDDVRLLGFQDTLLARRPPADSPDAAGRAYIEGSLIAGDVDFVFGDGTLVIAHSTLLSRAGRARGGYVLAPSTRPGQAHGILVTHSRFAAEPGVAAGSVALGRAWDEGVPAGQWREGLSPNGQALVRDSALGPHIAGWAASTSRRPFDAAVNRFGTQGNHDDTKDITRQTLAEGDGWASQEGGTRGGADALPRDVHTVRNRDELAAALAPHGRPRIVKVAAFIDLSGPEAQFRDPAFDRAAFERQFDSASWGRRAPEGPLEDARQRSAAQRAQVVLRVPSRSTLIGVTADAGLSGGTLLLERVQDVIVRNLRLSDAYDHFPAWDPADGRHGEWNSLYDNLSLVGATRVWIDRCSFDDGEHPDAGARTVFGRKVQHHDGFLDITRESDLVTVSHNHFKAHDKTSLVGGSDRHASDEGRLRITYRHNLWDGVQERAPRVRHGRVHVLGNVYRVPDVAGYGYSIGIGHRSRVLAEDNIWLTPGLPPERLARLHGGTLFSDRGSVLDGRPVSLLQALRATPAGRELDDAIGWAPPYAAPRQPGGELLPWVLHEAGAGRLIR